VELELVGLVGIEWTKPEAFPPFAGTDVQGRDDHRAACGVPVPIDGGGEYVRGEGGADPEVGVAAVDREPAEQWRRDRVWRVLGERLGRCRAVDSGHRNARLRDRDVIPVGDHPRGSGIAAAVPWRCRFRPFAFV